MDFEARDEVGSELVEEPVAFGVEADADVGADDLFIFVHECRALAAVDDLDAHVVFPVAFRLAFAAFLLLPFFWTKDILPRLPFQ